MYEMDIIYRLSMMVGFLTAGFLALLIAGAVIALRCWYKSTMGDLEHMIEALDMGEEELQDERKDN